MSSVEVRGKERRKRQYETSCKEEASSMMLLIRLDVLAGANKALDKLLVLIDGNVETS